MKDDDLSSERSEGEPSFAPTNDWVAVRLRASWLARLRTFFQTDGFLEVETPLLMDETVVDRHLDPVSVSQAAVAGLESADSASGPSAARPSAARPSAARPSAARPSADSPEEISVTYWLQTSPELGMKRMLATPGAPPALYQITRSFRGGESGALHNAEFTIVEWYRLGDDYEAGIQRLEKLSGVLFPGDKVERFTYRELFQAALGIDPLRGSIPDWQSVARAIPLSIPTTLGEDRDAWLDALFSLGVQPWLRRRAEQGNHVAIVLDYPASQAALARTRDTEDGAVAERYELFVNGVELANGYHELLDADELEQRVERANQDRLRDGKKSLPPPRRLLAAMRSGLPPCSGVALGLDRTLMVLAGYEDLSQVLNFPLREVQDL